MFKKASNLLITLTIIIFLSITQSYAEIIKNIEILGNERIPDETIKMFSGVQINDDVDQQNLNEILKNLYETNFFKNVSINVTKNNLKIVVVENPIIEKVTFKGIKSKTIKKEISENLNLKSRSSFNEFNLIDDKQKILSKLKVKGYYFATIDASIEELSNNRINLNYKIDIGNKAKPPNAD